MVKNRNALNTIVKQFPFTKIFVKLFGGMATRCRLHYSKGKVFKSVSSDIVNREFLRFISGDTSALFITVLKPEECDATGVEKDYSSPPHKNF